MIISKEYLTFKDVLDAGFYVFNDNDIAISKKTSGEGVKIITALTSVATPGAPFNDTRVDTLLTQYILPRYLDEYAVIVKNDEIKADKIKIWSRQFCNKLQCSFDEHKTLIDYYEGQKTHLLDTLSSSTTTRFNDTPQNGGDFTADSYTTNFTKTTVESDPGTVIQRLDEVKRKLTDIYEKWTDEFKPLFLMEVM